MSTRNWAQGGWMGSRRRRWVIKRAEKNTLVLIWTDRMCSHLSGGVCNERMHPRNNSNQSISSPTLCCWLTLLTYRHPPSHGGARFGVSNSRLEAQTQQPFHVLKLLRCLLNHVNYSHDEFWSVDYTPTFHSVFSVVASRRWNNEFHLSASGSWLRTCHLSLWLPQLTFHTWKERNTVYIFRNTDVCVCVYVFSCF